MIQITHAEHLISLYNTNIYLLPPSRVSMWQVLQVNLLFQHWRQELLLTTQLESAWVKGMGAGGSLLKITPSLPLLSDFKLCASFKFFIVYLA